MKRLFDITCSCLALLLLVIPMLVITLLVKFTSRGPVLYWSDRVGRNNSIFKGNPNSLQAIGYRL